MAPDDEDDDWVPPRTNLHSASDAVWRPLADPDGRDRYSLLEISGDSVDYDDVTGGAPLEFFVHEGALSAAGPLVLAGDGPPRVYVVEGDLVVSGPLVLLGDGQAAILWVRGSLRAQALVAVRGALLFVEGALTVDRELALYLSPAGHFIVDGELTTGVSIAASLDGCIAVPESAAEPLTGDELEARWSRHILEIPNRPLALVHATLAGLPLLAA